MVLELINSFWANLQLNSCSRAARKKKKNNQKHKKKKQHQWTHGHTHTPTPRHANPNPGVFRFLRGQSWEGSSLGAARTQAPSLQPAVLARHLLSKVGNLPPVLFFLRWRGGSKGGNLTQRQELVLWHPLCSGFPPWGSLPGKKKRLALGA